MANLRKSGKRAGRIAAFLLFVSLLGQTGIAGVSDIQAADRQTGKEMIRTAVQSPDPGALQGPDQGAAAGADTVVPPAVTAGTVRAEAGIIEVLSGFVDAKGKFWKMRSGSGFLIANKEHDTYIVTNSSNVSNTPQKIKKFCKKNEIDTENMQLVNTIKVVITGDVTADAEVVVKSAEKDYCILSAANVVSQKESLKLGDSARLMVNDMVYAYGFPEPSGMEGDTMQYSEMEVHKAQGAVTQTEAYLESGTYLAHSAPVMQGSAGGPLLDADGYVVGLNCKQSPEDDSGIAYALPINEITAVLDNFSIYYGSRAIDEARALLTADYQECMQIREAGGYKKASMEVLEQALAAAEEAMALEEPYAADLMNASQALLTARDGLIPKTETLTIAIVVLGVCDLLLLIWMLVVAVKNAKEKKQMELQRMQGTRTSEQNSGTPRQTESAAQLQNTVYIGQQNARYPGRQSVSGGQQGYPPAPAQQQAGYPPASVQQQAGYPAAPAQQQAGYPVQPARQNTDYSRRPVAPPAGRRLRMVRQKTGQTVVLNKNQFIIGKSQSLADFSMPDNQTVSRKHALLFEDQGGWYVDDLNSLNGTSVNGIKIVPGQPVRLKSGDEITMSDEAFLVQE